MKFSIKTTAVEKQKTSCLVAFIKEGSKLTESTSALDKASDNYISSIIKKGDITGKEGETLLLHNVPNLKAERVLLVGIGDSKDKTIAKFISTIKTIFSKTKEKNFSDLAIYLDDYKIEKEDLSAKVKQCVLIAADLYYSFDNFKSNPDKSKVKIKEVLLFSKNKKEAAKADTTIEEASAIAKGIAFTKDLVNTPANICNPNYLEKQSKELAKKYKKLSVAVLNTPELKKLKMGAILAVGQGSTNNPPKLITLEYRGAAASKKPYVLVGKGITFDTGGNSLKPAGSMIGMKYDMGGAASVLGTIQAVCELGLPINVVGVLAIAENMPGADAQRPDDIITSMKGTTIEVLNTDAEGRLVLCDALTYSERFKPAEVVDIATLTGAIIMALGNSKSGLFSNNDDLAASLYAAGEEICDSCWRLPIGPEYSALLKSPVADMANIGEGGAGSITAACFLEHFADKYPWAHLDIAGVAATGKGGKSLGTGRPVALLAQYLINKS